MNKGALVLPLACAAMLSLTLCVGCSPQNTSGSSASSSSSSSSQATQVVSPMVDCASSADLQEKSGLTLTAPADTQNITYSYIEPEAIAQMQCTYQGHSWTVREKKANAFEDFSGMMYEWKTTSTDTVDGQEIITKQAEGQACVSLGYRANDATMCSVSCADATVTPAETTALWKILFLA